MYYFLQWAIDGRTVLLMLGLFCCLLSDAQNKEGYYVGFSKASIEPPETIFGLALGGYGAPAEGRFSTTWKPMNAPGKLNTIASSGDELFALGADHKVYSAKSHQNDLVWKETFAVPSEIKAMAYVGKEKYLLDFNGQLGLYIGNKKKESVMSPPLDMVSSGGRCLYGFDRKGNIWRGDLLESKGKWTVIGKQEGIIALAVKDNELFFGDNQGRLWKAILGKGEIADRVQIARYNGITYAVNVKALAIVCNRLYALDQEGRLFIGSHKTEGNLEAGAAAIQYNGRKMIIVTVDVCGLNYFFTQDIKKLLAQQYSISPEAVLINASHTHFAPVSQHWTTWAHFYQKPDTNYLNQAVGKGIKVAVDKAIAAMEPATVYFGRGETFIGGNRDAGRVNREPVDRTLDVIKVENLKHQVMGVLFVAGCHPVFRNKGEEAFTLSANFPAVTRQLLAERTGCNNNLFIQGCAGDINPMSEDYRETGAELAKDVLNILSGPMHKIRGPITAFMDSVLIPVQPMTSEEISGFRQEQTALKGSVGVDKNIRWADLMDHRYRTNTLRKTLPVYVQTLNVGSWKLVGLSREAVTSYGREIRKLWPEQQVSVAGYCNDVSSYLPDRWHIEHRVYEGYDSFFWYGQEGIPPLDVQEMIIKKMKATNR